MSQPKALIFDVDGTLADTEGNGHRVAFNKAFREEGLDWHWDVATYGKLLAVTGGKERIRYFMDVYRAEFDRPANLDALIRKLHHSKTRHFVNLLNSGAIRLRPGVRRLLLEARARRLKLAIATTTTCQNVTTLLSATLGRESIGWFDVISAGDVVAQKKPAPDIYIHALKHMGLAASDCIAFEDSDNGLLSAINAGIKTIVTINAYTQRQDFAGALLVLDQLGEPDSAFTVLQGDARDATYVDISLINTLYEA